MIRINLLGVPRPKGKRAPVMTVMPTGSGGSPLTKVLLVLAVAGAANGYYWVTLDKAKREVDAKMIVAERTNRELSDVKARYMERQREAENYKRRVDVIDQLRNAQNGPVDLLNAVGDTVNKTEAVWLSSMKDNGATVDLDGIALSADAVANLMSNLQKSGNFKNIEIKETAQDEQVKDMQAFVFSLTCEKAGDKSGGTKSKS
jgi:type IV pilus assembly protein PilN